MKLGKVKKVAKRTKEIKIRLSVEEHEALEKRKTKKRLAQWLRELALEQKERTIKQTDPKLLYELNRIGVNLNQIAKNSNQAPIAEQIGIGIKLRAIEEDLKKILKMELSK